MHFTIVVPAAATRSSNSTISSVARPPHRFGHQGSHPHDQHVLVVGPVEDDTSPGSGQPALDPPEEIVLELFVGGLLERGDVDAGRVHR